MDIRNVGTLQDTSRRLRVQEIALIGLVAAGLGLAVATSIVGGIGWDGLYEVELGAILLQTTSDPASLQSLRQAWAPQDLSKGPLLFWVAQMIGATTPLPTWTGNVLDPHNYQLMGISSVLLGLVGVGILAGSLAHLLRSRVMGLTVLGLTMTLPLWVGLSALDYRDTLVASGLAAVTGAGLLTASTSILRRVGFPIILFAAIGGLLTVGSRSGSVLLLGAMLLWTVLVTLFMRHPEIKDILLRTLALTIGTLIGLTLAVFSHPLGRANPVQWLSEAVQLASDHPNVMIVRVLGQNIISNESPWWYVPAWLLAQTPILTTAAFAVIVVSFVALKPRPSQSVARSPALMVLLGPSLILPVAVLATSPNLFDGIRHLLFIVPPLFAVMATLAWALADRRIPFLGKGRQVRLKFVSWILVGIVAFSLFATARWFPYSYAFVNPVAGAIKEPRIWEYDYWGTTSREAISLLRDKHGVRDVFVRPSESSSRPFGGTSYEEYLQNPSGQWGGVTFFRFDAALPSECDVTITIRRDGIPLARAGICS